MGSAALLAMDLQRSIVERYPGPGYLARVRSAIAAARGAGLPVLSDGCLDAGPEVHRVLTEKVFPRQADVVAVDEWVQGR